MYHHPSVFPRRRNHNFSQLSAHSSSRLVVAALSAENLLLSKFGNTCLPAMIYEHLLSILYVYVYKGAGVTLRHYRANTTECSGTQELEPIEQNLQYDFNYQQSTVLPNPIKVMPVRLHGVNV